MAHASSFFFCLNSQVFLDSWFVLKYVFFTSNYIAGFRESFILTMSIRSNFRLIVGLYLEKVICKICILLSLVISPTEISELIDFSEFSSDSFYMSLFFFFG